jgi:hypothetical protein
MTYSDLRKSLLTMITIPTLGGRADIKIHNPAYGQLIAINSKGSAYQITETDWNNALVIRSRHPRNPWASKHYTGLGSFFSYGLIHAAALMRYIDEDGLEGLVDEASGTLVDAL